jgi:hypothetical membrane protein
MRPVFADIEIADNPVMLLVVGVFLLTFVAVCVIGFVVFSRGRRQGSATTWRLDVGGRVPVSQPLFDRIAQETRAAVAMPEVTPEVRETLDSLASVRRGLAVVYRTGLIVAGLAGLVGGILLLRMHSPGNTQVLPGAMIILLSLGALLSGLVPSRTVEPGEPLPAEMLRQMREKISVRLPDSTVTRVELGESELKRIAEMVRAGSSLPDALRAVYPPFDTLSRAEQGWIESTVATLVHKS